MNIFFTQLAWEQYLYWQTYDKKMLKRINELIKACQRAPFSGIGKPEPLRFELAGCWSRRIDLENRLVYIVDDSAIVILQCKYHY